jgi:hypothetical protein
MASLCLIIEIYSSHPLDVERIPKLYASPQLEANKRIGAFRTWEYNLNSRKKRFISDNVRKRRDVFSDQGFLRLSGEGAKTLLWGTHSSATVTLTDE